MTNIDWKNVDLSGYGFEMLKNPQKAYETMRLSQPGNSTSAASHSSTKNTGSSVNNSSQTKTNTTTQTKASKPTASQPEPKKQNVFENSLQQREPLHSKSPMFTKTYNWKKAQKERMQRFGIGLSPQANTQAPVLTRRTSTIDPDEEELTSAGEAAFLEGFRSAFEDDYKSGFWLKETQKTAKNLTAPKFRKKYYSEEDELTPGEDAAFREGFSSVDEDGTADMYSEEKILKDINTARLKQTIPQLYPDLELLNNGESELLREKTV